MENFSAFLGKRIYLVALVIIVAGCSVARSSRFAISPEIHQANSLRTNAYTKNIRGDHLGAIQIGNQILTLLDESNFGRDEMKYKAAIQRANAWYIIGTAKLFLSIQQSGQQINLTTILPLLGTPKGASKEFEKALYEISDGEQIQHKYRAQINPFLTKARTFMFLGRFQNAEDTFLVSIEWSSQATDPSQFLYADYYWRAYLRDLHGYALYVRDPDNKKIISLMWSSAIDDMRRAQKNTTNSEYHKVLGNWINATSDRLRLVR